MNIGYYTTLRSAYQKYLRTGHWRRISEKTKQLAGFRCQVVEGVERCKRLADQVHHTNYACLDHEIPGEDTIAVCGIHHLFLHGLVWRGGKPKEPVMWDLFEHDARTKRKDKAA